MKIVTDTQKMDFLFKAKVVAVDIETNTTPPPNTNAAGLAASYGLSYNADVIAISLSDGEQTAVFLDTHLYDERQEMYLSNFLQQVLCRDITIVGHNVLFDLRSLGGHYGFELPIETLVWDTMVMTRRMMLINEESSKFFKFGLLPVAKTWDLVSWEEEQFLAFMKSQRGRISDFTGIEDDEPELEIEEVEETAAPVEVKGAAQQLKDLPADHPVWAFAGNYGGTAPAALAKKSRILLEKYVAFDAILSYKIYQKQMSFVEGVTTCGKQKTYSPFKGVNMLHWPDLPQLTIEWQNQLRINANLAIKGLPVDMAYLEKRKAETLAIALDIAPKLLFEQDSTDPYPMFKEVFSQVLWYSTALNLVKNNDKYSQPIKKGVPHWVNWKRIPLDADLLVDAIEWDDDQTFEVDEKIGSQLVRNPRYPRTDPYEPEEPELIVESVYRKRQIEVDRLELKRVWAEWLVNLDPEMTRGEVAKSRPSQMIPPTINLQKWIRLQCFEDTKVGNYKAFLKTRWLSTYYRDYSYKDPIKLVSALHFKPYFIFAVAGWPLYRSEDLRGELALGTGSFQKKRAQMEKDRIPFDLQELAIDMDAFSCGKKPLEWIMSHLEDKEGNLIEDLPDHLREAAVKMRPYRELLNNWSTHKRMVEYWYHAQRDGKVHSILSPSTVTGRDGSTLPNLQNIKMKDFAGVFVPPADNFTLMELDLSNAENNMQVMITGDSVFAYDVMIADYHTEQAKLYWPEEFARLTALKDHKKLKELRSRGKTTTFARAYGAGVGKTASQLRVSFEEARKILDRVKLRYAQVTDKKEKLADSCFKRVKAGVLPAYVVMLNGSRAMVDSYNGKPQDYTQINYLAQGGVAVIIHKAMIAIEKYLHEHNYKTHMLMEVHDSIIFAVDHWEYANTTVMQDICEIMSSQVKPEELEKTIPAVAFVTETCPSNADKWGKQIDKDYALPMDEYINRWGRWKLAEYPDPDDPKKAPTWKGPRHEGWTVEKGMERQRASKGINNNLGGELTKEIKQPAPLPKVNSNLKAVADAKDWVEELSSLVDDIFTTVKTQYTDKDGRGTETPPLLFDERFAMNEALLLRGVSDNWNAQMAEYERLRNWLNEKLQRVEQTLSVFQ